MRVEAIRLKNFRAFRDVHMRDIPAFCVLIGANGTGKSTLFSVFSFLRDAMSTNVTEALARLGGNRGFQEVRSRNSDGPIEIELTIRTELGGDDLITYFLQLAEEGGQPIVERETLVSSRGGRSRHLIDFRRGSGEAVADERETEPVGDEVPVSTEFKLKTDLKSADILAIKALAQFARFPTAVALGSLFENCHLSDFGARGARLEQEAEFVPDEHLSPEGENLPLVVQYLQERQPRVFQEILTRLVRRIPGISHVKSDVTKDSRVVLKFHDGAFTEPFLARNVSDGTLKMLAYLVLLLDPKPHPLLCVEEPETHLYTSLLSDLAEDFRSYAVRGGQVFVSTHSPDFLNAVELDEVFWLVKQDGYTSIRRAKDDEQIAAYMADGDKLGYLWKQGLFAGADPA
jgi:predicted ATPase